MTMGLFTPFKRFWRFCCFFDDQRVAYLELNGMIAEQRELSSVPEFLDHLDKVEEEGFSAILLHINSPGGTVGASQAVYERLMELRNEKGVKIVVTLGDVSASGGVYVAMAAHKIISHGGTITGSIGVIIKSGNFRELLDKIGIQSEVVKSGEFKDILSTDRALTAMEKGLLQSTIDDTYEQFISVVAQGRNLDPETVKTFADGRIFTGRQALEYQLVDELGGKAKGVEVLKKLMGLPEKSEPKLVTFQKRKSILNRLIAGESLQGRHTSGQHISVFLRQWLDHQNTFSHIPLWLMPKS